MKSRTSERDDRKRDCKDDRSSRKNNEKRDRSRDYYNDKSYKETNEKRDRDPDYYNDRSSRDNRNSRPFSQDREGRYKSSSDYSIDKNLRVDSSRDYRRTHDKTTDDCGKRNHSRDEHHGFDRSTDEFSNRNKSNRVSDKSPDRSRRNESSRERQRDENVSIDLHYSKDLIDVKDSKDQNKSIALETGPPNESNMEIEETDSEMQMMMAMGFNGFSSTQGKKVNPDISAVNIKKKREYRQYMNRKDGFDRPLEDAS